MRPTNVFGPFFTNSLTLSSLQTSVKGFSSHNGSMVATTTLAVLYFIRY